MTWTWQAREAPSTVVQNLRNEHACDGLIAGPPAEEFGDLKDYPGICDSRERLPRGSQKRAPFSQLCSGTRA